MPTIKDSPETVRAFLEAEDIAKQSDQRLSSAHLLLALFTFPNRAQALLYERNIDEDRVLDLIRVLEDEPKDTLRRLRERAREIAAGSGSSDVDGLHVLIAITRFRDAFAYRLLERTGTSLTALRNIAVSYITGNMPRRFKSMGTTPLAPSPRAARVAPPRVLELDRAPPPPAQPSREDAPDHDDADADADASADAAADAFDDMQEAVEAAAEIMRPKAPLSHAAPPPRPGINPRSPPAPASLEELAPTLAGCAVDLTERARNNELDHAIGRDRELETLIDILGKRRSNNPVLVGPPGVGKTAIVEGLAMKIARRDDDVAHLFDRVIVSLDTGSLVAGTSLRGAFSERLGAIKTEVAAAGRRIIVFIDELHTLIGAGTSGEGSQDAANELKSALARGEFPCIGATTHDEFKKYIEKDPALERRFTPIFVEEPTPDEAILILEGAITPYAEHHRVDYSLDAVHAAVQLSHRFVPERQLPDKAFAVADLAGSRARRRGATRVERIDIARVVNEWTGVPLERLAEADADRFARAEAILGEQLIGHPEVITAVCRAVRRGFAGFNGRRPISSLLFLGPTGVGKTELVKILSEFLFGRRDAIVRVDMSEFSEPHSVARLIGAQPGYVGYDEGGQLTEALRRRPFQIVLFDEIEKAHRDVLSLLLQILDEGQLTDAKGRRVSFANALVVLTSNLGAERASTSKGMIGFSQDTSRAGLETGVLESARKSLAPELWGRIDEKLAFGPLSRDEVCRIATLQLSTSSRAIFAERGITLEWEPPVIEFLLDHGGFSPESGARGMRQTIQRHIEGPVAEKILAGELTPGDVAAVAVVGPDTLHIGRSENRGTKVKQRRGSRSDAENDPVAAR
ncbi:MAG: ATP-dependent Clp protease ATP-binding subunit [Deltaproteobacteria bacterium]|nr:ATP-dependent Clp protease ATP-binding subunit [Deltaproteobacteria bacterium]